MSIVRYIFLAFTLIALMACEKNNTLLSNPSKPLHIIYAVNYLGLHEWKDREQLYKVIGVDPVRTEWCAAFINHVLNEADIPGSESVSNAPLMARSFLTWGKSTDNPKLGDIVIFKRGNSGWQGHVAIYLDTVKLNNKTYYKILGGNQDDSVNISYYPKELLLASRKIKNAPG